MARWTRGDGEVEALLAVGDLQKLTGEAANGQPQLHKAAVTLETARSAVERDPDSAFVLAYDAARQALTALLAHQRLRPTIKGGHYAVQQATRAQFGPGFRQFGALRRRRNELDTPNDPTTTPPPQKQLRPSRTPRRSSPPAEGLIDRLGLF